MPTTSVQKLARALKVLVTITFVCNLIALVLVPFFVEQKFQLDVEGIVHTFQYDWDDGLGLFFNIPYYQVWQQPYTAVLCVFLWICGISTAFILWQARRVLDTILEGNPFQNANGISLRRAAMCCFLISAAALLRLLWGFVYYASILPLLTYNALFVPVFFMGGLLCLVMSALFRQAAELKAENDLTI